MIKELESLKKTEEDIKAVLDGKKDTFILDDTEAYTPIFKKEDFPDDKTRNRL